MILLHLLFFAVEIQAFSLPASSRQTSQPTRRRLEIEDVSTGPDTFVHISRRQAVLGSFSIFGVGILLDPASATAAAKAAVTSSDPVATIVSARETLEKLLDNWEKAVIDCTFADVPRELLEQKNKEELLEKASTFALFDKSVSVETCKTTNRVVRDYLGATGTLSLSIFLCPLLRLPFYT